MDIMLSVLPIKVNSYRTDQPDFVQPRPLGPIRLVSDAKDEKMRSNLEHASTLVQESLPNQAGLINADLSLSFSTLVLLLISAMTYKTKVDTKVDSESV